MRVKKKWTPPQLRRVFPDNIDDPYVQSWFKEGYEQACAGLPLENDLVLFSCASIAFAAGYQCALQLEGEAGLLETVP